MVSDGALTHDYTVATPAGQAPLGARDGEGLDNALAVLYHNYKANLENMRLRGSGGVILGVKQIQAFINAGPETLVRPDYGGNGWAELPEELVSKRAIINIQSKDNRFIGYCLIA